jgi:hypothetical protein
MMGTCKGCGTENVEVNEQGLCAACAAKMASEGGMPETPSTPTEGGTPAM